MPIPKLDYSSQSGKNPFSTITIPESALKEHGRTAYKITGLASSTTYTVGTPAASQLPALWFVAVDGTAEYGLFSDSGGDGNLVRVAGSSNVETVDNAGAATSGKLSFSKVNTTGAFTLVTGASTLPGTAVTIYRIV